MAYTHETWIVNTKTSRLVLVTNDLFLLESSNCQLLLTGRDKIFSDAKSVVTRSVITETPC